jgi:hypothetical protein
VPTTELDMPEAINAARKKPAAALPRSGVSIRYAVSMLAISGSPR